MENIEKRGRKYEQRITEVYLKKIEKSYFDFFKSQPNLKILVINSNNIDFVNNQTDYNKIQDIIFSKQYNPGLNRVFCQ